MDNNYICYQINFPNFHQKLIFDSTNVSKDSNANVREFKIKFKIWKCCTDARERIIMIC